MAELRLNGKTLALSAAVGAILGLLPLPDASAATLPQFDRVIHGSIERSYDDPNHPQHLLINGRGRNNVLQWHSFDIGRDQKVTFSSGNFLNLVKDKKASRIDGTLVGHGSSVFIVNPRGITFGKDSSVDVGRLGLSTAQPTTDMLNKFIQSSSDLNDAKLSLSSFKGMGKVRLLGELNTQNLIVDGGQIIIRDLHSLVDENQHPLTPDSVTLQSSVQRIDVGFGEADATEAQALSQAVLGQHSDIISHQGESALSSADEAKALLSYTLQGKYWLTDNLNLQAPLADTFSGSLDGAYNHVSFTLAADGTAPVGLFGTLQDAVIKNLALTDSTIDLTAATTERKLTVGGLAGSIQDSRLEQIEINNLSLKLPATPTQLSVGALAGNADGSNTLTNVCAGFSSTTAATLSGSANAGSLFGSLSGELKAQGLTAGLNPTQLAAVGHNASASELAASFADASVAAAAHGEEEQLAAYALTSDGTQGHLKLFMQPYFVSNFTYTYDGSSHNYEQDLCENFSAQEFDSSGDLIARENITIFNPQELVSFDNAHYSSSGDVSQAGLYGYSLGQTAGTALFDGFYLVQPDDATGSPGAQTLNGEGYIQIHKRPLGTIEVGDTTMYADETPNGQVINADKLNFAPGESLDDFTLHFTPSRDSTKLELTIDGLSTNYSYTIHPGTLTLLQRPDPEIPTQPDPQPQPKPDHSLTQNPQPEAVTPPLSSALAFSANVTPCNYCKGRERLGRLYQKPAAGALYERAAAPFYAISFITTKQLAQQSQQNFATQLQLAATQRPVDEAKEETEEASSANA